MHEKRRIAYGVGNWAELVRDGKYFFVDHTAYIRELERFRTPVFLRPRRFGKTMWCSLLECYYDVGMKKDFKMLFGKTEIGRNPTELRNSFLILRLNIATMVSLEPALLGMLGFTQRDVDRYVDEIYAEYGFDPAKEVEAYVCSIVGNRSYAFCKVKV